MTRSVVARFCGYEGNCSSFGGGASLATIMVAR